MTAMTLLACHDCKWCTIFRDGPTCTHPLSFHTQTAYYPATQRSVAYNDQGMRSIGPCKPEAILFSPRSAGGQPLQSLRGLPNRYRHIPLLPTDGV